MECFVTKTAVTTETKWRGREGASFLYYEIGWKRLASIFTTSNIKYFLYQQFYKKKSTADHFKVNLSWRTVKE